MVCEESDRFVKQVTELYGQILKLKSLRPSQEVDTLFGQLMNLCMPNETNIDVQKLSQDVQEMRSHLIKLGGEVVGYSEKHFSSILGSLEGNPVDHIDLFPTYQIHLNVSKLESELLTKHTTHPPTKIAFVGSGSMPLSSITLAKYHLPKTTFHNFDIDPHATALASRLVSRDVDLSKRMAFHTTDLLNMTTEVIREYDVIFLAALVGLQKEAKVKAIEHLEKHMAPGALLMLRSGHGLRAFIYHIIEPCDLKGFEILTIYHPVTSDVVNSVVVARNSVVRPRPG